jgi:hypothetical protein
MLLRREIYILFPYIPGSRDVHIFLDVETAIKSSFKYYDQKIDIFVECEEGFEPSEKYIKKGVLYDKDDTPIRQLVKIITKKKFVDKSVPESDPEEEKEEEEKETDKE